MVGIEWMLAGLAVLLAMVAAGQLWFAHRVFALLRAVTAAGARLDASLTLSEGGGVLLRVANLSNTHVWLDKATLRFEIRYVSESIASDLPLSVTVEAFSLWEREVSNLVRAAPGRGRREPGSTSEIGFHVEVFGQAAGRDFILHRAIGLLVGPAGISRDRPG